MWSKAAVAATGERLVPRGHLGIQLFTVRDKVAALGFLPVFQELASIGYKEVEFAGYRAQGMDVPTTQIRQWLDQTGLNGIGTHIGYTQFLTNINQVLDDAENLGLPYVGTANSPGVVHGETTDGYKRAAADFNNFGAAAAARGMRFYQHNHSGEFAIDPTTGIRLYDTILAETDPSLVFFELDIFWAYVGQSRFPGFDPIQLVAAQPHRFPLYHVKDGVMDGGPSIRLDHDRRRRRRHRLPDVLHRGRDEGLPPLHRRARHRTGPRRQSRRIVLDGPAQLPVPGQPASLIPAGPDVDACSAGG